MNRDQVRELTTAIAPHLPGEWSATWEDHTVGAYLVSGNMKLFLSAQTGWGYHPGMVRISPQIPSDRNVGEREENKSASIYVREAATPEVFAKEINRRILVRQDYAAKVARQVAAIKIHADADNEAHAVAIALGAVLGASPRGGTEISAYPHGTWRASSNSVHLDIYLPVPVALKVARMITEEM